MAKQQRSRAKKESKGIHGGGGKGRPLTDIEKILISNGGLLRNVKPRWAAPVKG